jgi:hypothetical protein
MHGVVSVWWLAKIGASFVFCESKLKHYTAIHRMGEYVFPPAGSADFMASCGLTFMPLLRTAFRLLTP